MERLSLEDFINRSNKQHDGKYDYSKSIYINSRTKIKIICPIHGEFEQNPNIHMNGAGCIYCAGTVLLTWEEINKNLQKMNNIPSGSCFSTIDVYTKNTHQFGFFCGLHGWTKTSWNHLQRGNKPPCCSRKSPINNNSIRYIYPNLVKYLVNERDADKYTYGVKTKLKFKCPNCGEQKNIIPYVFYRQGFGCPICSDGISIPEKFITQVLNQIDVKFETQYSDTWSYGMRYDFYIPSLNMIIETHGEQHYKEGGKWRSLNKEQQNDILKQWLADDNDIKYYVTIDCRKSEIEWLKNNCIKGFGEYFDLDNVDWSSIWENCQGSKCVEAWDLWNNKKDFETVKHISDKLNINRSTVIIYLKRGTYLARCFYDPKEESRKSGRF